MAVGLPRGLGSSSAGLRLITTKSGILELVPTVSPDLLVSLSPAVEDPRTHTPGGRSGAPAAPDSRTRLTPRTDSSPPTLAEQPRPPFGGPALLRGVGGSGAACSLLPATVPAPPPEELPRPHFGGPALLQGAGVGDEAGGLCLRPPFLPRALAQSAGPMPTGGLPRSG